MWQMFNKSRSPPPLLPKRSDLVHALKLPPKFPIERCRQPEKELCLWKLRSTGLLLRLGERNAFKESDGRSRIETTIAQAARAGPLKQNPSLPPGSKVATLVLFPCLPPYPENLRSISNTLQLPPTILSINWNRPKDIISACYKYWI